MFANGDSLTVVVTTGAHREAERVVKLHEQEVDDVRSKEGADIPEMENYFSSSEILKD